MNKTILTLIMLLTLFSSSAHGQNPTVKGFTEPYRSIDIAAPEVGVISQVLVAEGDHVKSGAILARLNEDILKVSLAIAGENKDAKGRLNSALAELSLQQKRHEKLAGLFDRHHASQTEIDRAKAQLEVAHARVETVKDELQIKKLELVKIQAQLEQRRLRSPIDGIVTEVFKEQGEFVSPNDPAVVTVVQLDPLLVIFSVPQEQATRLFPGNQISLQMGTSTNQLGSASAKGIVEFVSPTADAQSGTCRVKIKIDNSDRQWLSGQACYLDIEALKRASSTSKLSHNAARTLSRDTP